jgi:hypothetical protein
MAKNGNRRDELQRMLGDVGEVLPRVAHGSKARPAQGWYAKVTEGPRAGKEVFLGDYSMLAGLMITRLHDEIAAAEQPKRRRRARA